MALTVITVIALLVPQHSKPCNHEKDYVSTLRVNTNYMMEIMGRPRFPISKRTNYACSVFRPKGFVRKLWKNRYQRTKLDFKRPPHYEAWLCLYRYESGGYGWSVNTGNGYYGGLQMDINFQQAYGRHLFRWKGTADHWTPLEQMWTGEAALRSGTGFYPWPNTGRACGLI